MKQLSILTLLLFLAVLTNAQSTSAASSEIEELTNSIEEEARQLKINLQQDKTTYYFHKDLNIEYHIDTFKIEQTHVRTIEINNTTTGMVRATAVALQSYDRLLNKYYKKLLHRLDETDQETLRKTQRNWISLRDNEIELIQLLAKNEYSGGGSIQRLITADRILNLTKNRLDNLFKYLVETIE